MRADIHDGPEHNTLQAEAGYIDARPYLPDRRNLLQRTAGPYIRVILCGPKSGPRHPHGCKPLKADTIGAFATHARCPHKPRSTIMPDEYGLSTKARRNLRAEDREYSALSWDRGGPCAGDGGTSRSLKYAGQSGHVLPDQVRRSGPSGRH